MSLTKDILRVIAIYYPLGNATLYEHLYGETARGKKINKRSVDAIVRRMKRNGLLVKNREKLSLTTEGKSFLDKNITVIKKFFNHENFLKNKEKSKNLIVIFDIPEKKKRYREWLRLELIGFGFTMIQKSVWLGPALPKGFIEYLGETGILKHIRFFRAEEKDLI